MYGDALFLSGDYQKAKAICEHALEGAHDGAAAAVTSIVILPHLHLSFILQDLDIEHEEQQRYTHFIQHQYLTANSSISLFRHTKWSVEHLKKYPHAIKHDILRQFLILQNGKNHPVLERLGGVAWLTKLGQTERRGAREEARDSKKCRNCNVSEIQKKLFKCGKCQQVFYW